MTRGARKRKAAERVKVVEQPRPSTGLPRDERLTRSAMVYVTKSGESPDSRQIVDPFSTLYQDGMAIEPPLDPERLLLLAEESTPHGACLEAKADDTTGSGEAGSAERGWDLLAIKSEGGEGEDPEDAAEALADLLEDLTPDLTFDEILWAAAYEEDAVGWAGVEVVRAENGDIAALYPMPAHTIRFTKDPDVVVQMIAGQARYFKRFGSDPAVNARTGAKAGQDQRVSTMNPNDVGIEDVATEVIVFRGYSGRSKWYPIPRWITVVPAIAELTAIREFNVSFFGSGGTVDRLLHVTAGDVEAAKTIAATIDEELTEAAGLGHVTIVTAGDPQSNVEPHFLVPSSAQGGSGRDGQFSSRRGDLTGEVLMGHKVPPYRVAQAIAGVLTGSGPSREMLQAYRAGVVAPRQRKHSSRWNSTLFGQGGLDLRGYRFVFRPYTWDETELDRALAESIASKGIGSPNEARAIIGLGKHDDPKMELIYWQGQELGKVAAPSPGDPFAPAVDPLAPAPAPADPNDPNAEVDGLLAPEGDTTTPAAELDGLSTARRRTMERIRERRDAARAAAPVRPAPVA